jgi:hypothetical protein
MNCIEFTAGYHDLDVKDDIQRKVGLIWPSIKIKFSKSNCDINNHPFVVKQSTAVFRMI